MKTLQINIMNVLLDDGREMRVMTSVDVPDGATMYDDIVKNMAQNNTEPARQTITYRRAPTCARHQEGISRTCTNCIALRRYAQKRRDGAFQARQRAQYMALRRAARQYGWNRS